MKTYARILGVILITLLIGLGIAGLAACSSPGSSTNTSTSTSSTPQNTTISLTAQNTKFDKSTITVPAGSHVTINFSNMDAGIQHNFSLYTNSSATSVIFTGQLKTGVTTTNYTFTAPATPGTYFFRCDIHPTLMTGSFIVQ